MPVANHIIIIIIIIIEVNIWVTNVILTCSFELFLLRFGSRGGRHVIMLFASALQVFDALPQVFFLAGLSIQLVAVVHLNTTIR